MLAKRARSQMREPVNRPHVLSLQSRGTYQILNVKLFCLFPVWVAWFRCHAMQSGWLSMPAAYRFVPGTRWRIGHGYFTALGRYMREKSYRDMGASQPFHLPPGGGDISSDVSSYAIATVVGRYGMSEKPATSRCDSPYGVADGPGRHCTGQVRGISSVARSHLGSSLVHRRYRRPIGRSPLAR